MSTGITVRFQAIKRTAYKKGIKPVSSISQAALFSSQLSNNIILHGRWGFREEKLVWSYPKFAFSEDKSVAVYFLKNKCSSMYRRYVTHLL
jgi:hypothetical protein